MQRPRECMLWYPLIQGEAPRVTSLRSLASTKPGLRPALQGSPALRVGRQGNRRLRGSLTSLRAPTLQAGPSRRRGPPRAEVSAGTPPLASRPPRTSRQRREALRRPRHRRAKQVDRSPIPPRSSGAAVLTASQAATSLNPRIPANSIAT